jgi:hypothetical protein
MGKEKYLELMLETARRVAMDAGVDHPEDLASYLIMSIESTSVLLEMLWIEDRGVVRNG